MERYNSTYIGKRALWYLFRFETICGFGGRISDPHGAMHIYIHMGLARQGKKPPLFFLLSSSFSLWDLFQQ